jgi:antitoxin VapB
MLRPFAFGQTPIVDAPVAECYFLNNRRSHMMDSLQVENPRALELAQELAEKRRVSLSDAVIGALEAELGRENERQSRIDRLRAIADDLWAQRKPGGRDMTKDEIDAMWGHE